MSIWPGCTPWRAQVGSAWCRLCQDSPMDRIASGQTLVALPGGPPVGHRGRGEWVSSAWGVRALRGLGAHGARTRGSPPTCSPTATSGGSAGCSRSRR
jgi:hypothetical protein